MARYAEVVVPLPVEGRFHYLIPEHLEGALEIGHRVLVPFGPRRVTGFVVGFSDEVPAALADKLKPIAERLDVEPLVPRDVLALATFAAEYYLAPVGEVLKLALPPGLTAASKARWVITQAGRHFMDAGLALLPNGERLGTAARRLLEAAVRAQGVAAGDANPKAALELEALGLIARREVLSAKEAQGEIELIERVRVEVGGEGAPPGPSRAHVEAKLGRAQARRAVWELLQIEGLTQERIIDELGDDFEPPTLKAAVKQLEKDGLLTRRRVAPRAEEREEAPYAGTLEQGPELMPEQAAALEALVGGLERREAAAFLLHGVTGSGKTEVYLRAIARAREMGRGAIVLVPEIALTPQLEARFRARFGDDVAVLHSALLETERRRRWLRLRRGEAHIALGPRSAVWAPVSDLGIIVVDEEHDASFKQNSDVRYHGRDLALTRAHRAKGVALLGSATPSLETLHLVEQGRVTELRLRDRAMNRPMPRIEVVDLAEERRVQKKGEPRVLSRRLADRLRATVEAKEQAILFLNRRGFNTVVFCEDCGEARCCSGCDVSMTYHKTTNQLMCHYCGRIEALDAPCRKCRSRSIRPFGVGTQRVVEAVREEAPEARVLRLDRDVTADKGELERTLQAFRDGAADILVGTQMVAKGHDFPRVTLVGVVLADASLAFPDFRAAERTFQLITQVSGRAGRADSPGRVVIQTFQREHYALKLALEHDAHGFFKVEGASRESAGYPPFSRIGLLRMEARNEAAVRRAADTAKRIALRLGERDREVRVRGPVAAPIARIRERHRMLLMVFAPTPARLSQIMRRLRAELEADAPRVDLFWDVDPTDLL